MLQLIGKDFSGIFTTEIEIKASLSPGHIHIITDYAVLTFEDQIIESKGSKEAKFNAKS